MHCCGTGDVERLEAENKKLRLEIDDLKFKFCWAMQYASELREKLDCEWDGVELESLRANEE